jgi:HEAT repeat protein
LSVLETGLNNKNTLVRLESIRVLADIAPDAAGAAKALHGLLNDRHPEIRHAATEALRKIEPKGR